MHKNISVKFCAQAFIAVCLAVPAISLAQVPALSIPQIELTAGLSPSSSQQIDEVLTYYADMIRNAQGDQKQKQQQIITGRDGIRTTYNTYESSPFKQAVAERSVEIVAPLLELDDTQKQINVAMALAAMSQASTQASFEKMISHSNPAVRYLGWIGYGNARTTILAKPTTQASETMFASLAKAVAEEESSIVMRAVFEALNFPIVKPEGLSRGRYDAARRKALEVMAGNWAKQCDLVRYGDWQMSEAFRRAVSAIANGWPLLSGDAAQRTKYLQMIVDVAWSSAQAYEAAMRVAERAEGLTKDDAESKILTNTLLLRSCEQALKSITKISLERDYIAHTLTDTSIPDRASAPRWWKDPSDGKEYGVLAWIEELKGEGVTVPKAPEVSPEATGTPGE